MAFSYDCHNWGLPFLTNIFIITLHVSQMVREQPSLSPGSPSKPFVSCLLVASNAAATGSFVRALHEGGIAILQREPGDSALALGMSGDFDVVAWVVDCGPSIGGELALARLAHAGQPVIVLHSEARPDMIASALTAGAEACLDLAADPRVVLAQVRAVLRRVRAYDGQAPETTGLLQVGEVTVDIDRCEVQRAGVHIPLTATEFRILEYMARNAGRVLRAHEILNAVSADYQYLPREAQDVFKVYVRRIRRKLEADQLNPRHLVTVRGFGYRLEGGHREAGPRYAVHLA